MLVKPCEYKVPSSGFVRLPICRSVIIVTGFVRTIMASMTQKSLALAKGPCTTTQVGNNLTHTFPNHRAVPCARHQWHPTFITSPLYQFR